MTANPVLEKILANLDQLPELPTVAIQVNRLLDDPNASAQDLARIITLDATLTSKVLKLCNSAEYGFSRKIGTISEAVSILGFKHLKQMIMTIISHGFLNRPVQGYALEHGALWENALTCAVYARHISDKIKFNNSELAFIAALLRDIGKVAIEAYVKGNNIALEETVKQYRCSFEEAEEKIVGASHTYVGAQMAAQWNLPESLVTAIAFHHHPSHVPADASLDDKKLVAIVHLADTYTMMAGHGLGIDGLMYPLDISILQTLGLPEDNGALEAMYVDMLTLQDDIQALATPLEAR